MTDVWTNSIRPYPPVRLWMNAIRPYIKNGHRIKIKNVKLKIQVINNQLVMKIYSSVYFIPEL
jgi:hypothetical protein